MLPSSLVPYAPGGGGAAWPRWLGEASAGAFKAVVALPTNKSCSGRPAKPRRWLIFSKATKAYAGFVVRSNCCFCRWPTAELHGLPRLFFRFAVRLKTKLVLLAAPPPLCGPETMVATSHNFAQLGVVANVPLNANY